MPRTILHLSSFHSSYCTSHKIIEGRIVFHHREQCCVERGGLGSTQRGREISNNMEFYFAFSSILFERYRNKNSKNDKSEILPSIRYEILSRRKANEKKKRFLVRKIVESVKRIITRVARLIQLLGFVPVSRIFLVLPILTKRPKLKHWVEDKSEYRGREKS